MLLWRTHMPVLDRCRDSGILRVRPSGPEQAVAFLPDITTIRLFVSVVEEASIARAARRERIAASAISKRISEMEQRLGLELLRRHASGVEITAAGAAFLRRARRILQESEQIDAELRQLRQGVHGIVRVAASETTMVGLMPSVLSGFLRDNPGIHVELYERNHTEVVRAVREQEVDIGMLAADSLLDGVWNRPCYRDQLVAVMRKDHPLAGYPGVTLAELLDHDLIGPDRSSALGTLIRRQAEMLGRSLRSRVAANGFDVICRLVQQGLGIGIVAESSFRLFAGEPNLLSLPVLNNWARRQHRVCVRRLETLSPAARLLLERMLPGNG